MIISILSYDSSSPLWWVDLSTLTLVSADSVHYYWLIFVPQTFLSKPQLAILFGFPILSLCWRFAFLLIDGVENFCGISRAHSLRQVALGIVGSALMIVDDCLSQMGSLKLVGGTLNIPVTNSAQSWCFDNNRFGGRIRYEVKNFLLKG